MMQIHDVFSLIKDYIEAENIVDEIENFLCDDELEEFCDHLKEKYIIDVSEDVKDFYDYDDTDNYY